MKPPLAEKFLYPKELALALEVYGFHGLSERACRLLARRLREDKLPITGRCRARAIDAASWLLSHPEWRPFDSRARAPKPRGLALTAR